MMAGKNGIGRDALKKFLKPSDGIGIELGVWTGGTTQVLKDYFSELHAVDAWNSRAYYNTTEWSSYDNYVNRYCGYYNIPNNEKSLNAKYDRVYNHVVDKLKDSPHVHIHRMTTDEFFESFDKEVDFIYIDASHSEDDVYRDITNSYNILKKGGMIIGDDYNVTYKIGVTLAWDRFIKENDLSKEVVNTQIIIYK
jgi:hypothetical protein